VAIKAMNPKTIRKVMAELGRRGGSKTSTAKKKAAAKSLKKARAVRWPQHHAHTRHLCRRCLGEVTDVDRKAGECTQCGFEIRKTKLV
jgi:hypothetical protein